MDALAFNETGTLNTASGSFALFVNTTGVSNTALGAYALSNNGTGNYNTALGHAANVASDNLTNATAIGANAIVNASNKIQLGDGNVTLSIRAELLKHLNYAKRRQIDMRCSILLQQVRSQEILQRYQIRSLRVRHRSLLRRWYRVRADLY